MFLVEFASYIFKVTSLNVKVKPVSTEKYKRLVPAQADRPLNSRMNKKYLIDNGFNLLPAWQDAVSRYMRGEMHR
jgi:dTDP-4-dehydrorhamnose reductase